MPRKSASGSAKPLRKADNRRGGYVGSALSSNAEPAYRNAAAKAPTTTTQVRGAQRLGNAVARYVPDVSVSVNGKTYGGREQLAGSIRNTALGGIGAPNNAQRGGKVTQTGNWYMTHWWAGIPIHHRTIRKLEAVVQPPAREW